MKYGLLVFQGNHGKNTSRPTDGTFNVGDNIQMLAMLRIYRERMGLKKEDLIPIDFHDLASYQGEPVVLPINFFFFGCKSATRQWFPASPNIVPVFLGLHLDTQILDPETVQYLQTYAPIGCRDAYTLRTMQKYHIPAYLGGCVTATLPIRQSTLPPPEIMCYLKERYFWSMPLRNFSHIFPPPCGRIVFLFLTSAKPLFVKKPSRSKTPSPKPCCHDMPARQPW